MISAIAGKVTETKDNALVIACGALSYEVLVPRSVLQRVQENQDSDGNVRLITYHYLQVSPSSASPVLVGFFNKLERDFFLEFIKVSGIGPRAAVKALNKSIGEIAQAIDRGDTAYLRTLPGIGLQRAKEIVAKLQGKMGGFTLMRDKVSEPVGAEKAGLKEEALAILLQLQYKRPEAEAMIEAALKRAAEIQTSQELLNEIYKQRTTV